MEKKIRFNKDFFYAVWMRLKDAFANVFERYFSFLVTEILMLFAGIFILVYFSGSIATGFNGFTAMSFARSIKLIDPQIKAHMGIALGVLIISFTRLFFQFLVIMSIRDSSFNSLFVTSMQTLKTLVIFLFIGLPLGLIVIIIPLALVYVYILALLGKLLAITVMALPSILLMHIAEVFGMAHLLYFLDSRRSMRDALTTFFDAWGFATGNFRLITVCFLLNSGYYSAVVMGSVAWSATSVAVLSITFPLGIAYGLLVYFLEFYRFSTIFVYYKRYLKLQLRTKSEQEIELTS